ncbi:MAG: helix-turn-helix transcriptional regulator [Acidimicrobiia bacterium]|nr:helix-turn-helix transcriptional regulator [Acidimicrobiia bacterium]
MATTAAPTFGEVLRLWRTTRRMSQLGLAAEAEVSQRHLSFLETGRAKPSREMVTHLAAILDLPLRARNDMLLSAGFAPAFPETALDEPAMDQVRHVLEFLLEAHEPFPAIVVDRRWNSVMTNEAAGRFLAGFIDLASAAAIGPNLARLTFHPGGLRSTIVNWDEAAGMVLQRLEREVADRAGDLELAALLDEVLEYPGVADLQRAPELPSGRDLLVPVHYRADNRDVRMFSTIATIGAAYDVTLEELRLETFFPADPDSEAVLRAMAG